MLWKILLQIYVVVSSTFEAEVDSLHDKIAMVLWNMVDIGIKIGDIVIHEDNQAAQKLAMTGKL